MKINCQFADQDVAIGKLIQRGAGTPGWVEIMEKSVLYPLDVPQENAKQQVQPQKLDLRDVWMRAMRALCL